MSIYEEIRVDKIKLIKIVKGLFGLGLKETKTIVEVVDETFSSYHPSLNYMGILEAIKLVVEKEENAILYKIGENLDSPSTAKFYYYLYLFVAGT